MSAFGVPMTPPTPTRARMDVEPAPRTVNFTLGGDDTPPPPTMQKCRFPPPRDRLLRKKPLRKWDSVPGRFRLYSTGDEVELAGYRSENPDEEDQWPRKVRARHAVIDICQKNLSSLTRRAGRTDGSGQRSQCQQMTRQCRARALIRYVLWNVSRTGRG